MPEQNLTPLLITNRAVHWLRVRLSGSFKRTAIAIDAIIAKARELQQEIPETSHWHTDHAVEKLERIKLEMEALHAEAVTTVNEVYEVYRNNNPPIRDRNRKRK